MDLQGERKPIGIGFRSPLEGGINLEYLHYNPVKHGLAQTPSQYPWSTFHRHVRSGVYEPEWGGSEDADLLRQFECLKASEIEYGE